MKRLSTLCVLAIAALAATAGAVSASSSHAKLRSFVCKHALLPKNRALSVTAVMRPIAGTQRMALKFELIGRNKRTHKLIHVKAGDLGRWIKPVDATLGSRPGDVWIFRHPVKDIAAPVTYRFHVFFRWTDQGGRTLETVQRVSKRCYQPELRPDLLVSSISVKRISGQSNERYVATIRNAGVRAAGAFQVEFTDGGAVQRVTVQRLAAHAQVRETFVGPACTPANPPVVTADPAHRVPDSDPANNSMTASCS